MTLITTDDHDGDPLGQARMLIERRMPFRSLAELERATGIDDLSQKLDSAARSGRLPKFDLMIAVCAVTDIQMAELGQACAVDAGYPDLFPPISAEEAAAVHRFLLATPQTRKLMIAWLDWLESDHGSPPSP